MRSLAALVLTAAVLPAADPPALADKKKELLEQALKALADIDPKGKKADVAAAYARVGDVFMQLREPEKAADAFTRALDASPDPRVQDRRGDARLWAGKFADAVADYDAFLKAEPKFAPKHWRRGIALYYAGRHEDGVKQFALHKEANPEDVENAAWHYLCNVKGVGKEKARKELIDVTKDPRVPMAEIQKLFAGTLKPGDVLAAADKVKGAERTSAQFYAHLYVGLWYEAEGDEKSAQERLTTAVEKYEVPDYMWDVGNAHLKALKAKQQEKK